jgi:hypothetical protein
MLIMPWLKLSAITTKRSRCCAKMSGAPSKYSYS